MKSHILTKKSFKNKENRCLIKKQKNKPAKSDQKAEIQKDILCQSPLLQKKRKNKSLRLLQQSEILAFKIKAV